MIDLLNSFLDKISDKNIATLQSKYMRNRFQFLGIKKDLLYLEYKKFKNIHNCFDDADTFIDYIIELTKKPQREFWYIAILELNKNYEKFLDKSNIKISDLKIVEDLLIKSDWWDIVDMLATNIVGRLASYSPPIKDKVNSWVYSDNLWLRRTSVIYQLKYRENTNIQTLYNNILLLNEEKEFFIQKAIGWSLREFSKTNSKSVSIFINSNKDILSKLSIREGSKYIKN